MRARTALVLRAESTFESTARLALTTNSKGVLNFARKLPRSMNSGLKKIASYTFGRSPLLERNALSTRVTKAGGGESFTKYLHSLVAMKLAVYLWVASV